MRIGIKSKILLSTGLIVMLTLAASGTFAYFYFNNILEAQIITDNKAKLEQKAMQLEYIIKDIRNYSYNIALDSKIQFYLNNNNDKVNSIDQVFYINEIAEKLSDIVAMRDYIHSVAIKTKYGKVYWNRSPYDNYFSERLNEPWYIKFEKANSNNGFTDAHEIVQKDKSQNVISYVMKFRDSSDYNSSDGELIINIYYEYLENIVKSGSQEYDAYYWLSKDNSILFGQVNRKFSSYLPDYLNQMGNGSSNEGLSIQKGNGYTVLDKSISNTWNLVLFVTKAEIYQKTKYILFFFILFIIISLALIIIFNLPVIHKIIRPVFGLNKAMKQVAGGNLDVNLSISSKDEMEDLYKGFNSMVRDLKNYIRESEEYEKTKHKMEFDLLLSQINPHFIYNTLHTVIYLAKKQQYSDITNMIQSFIKILQDAIRIGEGGITVPIRQEIDTVKHYALIQQYRYRDRFEIIWQVDEELLDCIIPKTLLQPLVENALLHGILPDNYKGIITIRIYRKANDVIIVVEDNGVGIDSIVIEEIMKGNESPSTADKMRSIGIPNVKGRIEYLYGLDYGMHISSEPGIGTKVEVNVPYNVMNNT